MAVNRLMIAPAARGLFHRAVSQSGAGREAARRLDQPNAAGLPSALEAGTEFARSLGVPGNDAAALAALRATPAERIIATEESPLEGGGPIIDGTFITMDVGEAFAAGNEAPVSYLAGYNSTEIPTPPDRLEPSLARIADSNGLEPQALRALYPDETALAQHVVGDVVFAEPSRWLAAQHAANGAPTYLYRFDVVSSSMRDKLSGAPHAQERQYVFGTLGASPWPTDPEDETHAGVMSAYWLDFARSGNPNGSDRPRWPLYDADVDQLLEFGNKGPVARATPFAKRLDAITSLRNGPGNADGVR
jgi:para-nitrobenzyl esterase